MLSVISPLPYAVTVVVVVMLGAGACAAARRHPGSTARLAARAFGAVLALDAAVWWLVVVPGQGHWSVAGSLPLALCNMAVFVTAAACWWQTPLLVELTWFWGLAGALQALITPDLTTPFPRPEFFQYTLGHLAVVLVACYLVIGLRLTPRPGAVWRVFGLTLAYTAGVGVVDAVSGANYMFLRGPPGRGPSSTSSGRGRGTCSRPARWRWVCSRCSTCPSGCARRADRAPGRRAVVPHRA